ncbi:MAG TPA: cell division/cell wall cluster transcriptional repressor MraZ, partial [bacterium]|nr:cell division/cell wall cluster transcriptional repressor MraZ [bacterium]
RNLREYAMIDREIVIIGVSNRLEIWSAELWDKYSGDSKEFYRTLGEALNDIDI